MLKFLETDWKTSQHKLKMIRQAVFVDEQHVPVELEWDSKDATAIHLLAIHADAALEAEPVGTSRIIINHHQARIGRMAVLKKWRHQGIGSKLLQQSLTICKQQKVHDVSIDAQEYIIPFYTRAGFNIVSERFMDAGIPHKKMHISLT